MVKNLKAAQKKDADIITAVFPQSNSPYQRQNRP